VSSDLQLHKKVKGRGLLPALGFGADCHLKTAGLNLSLAVHPVARQLWSPAAIDLLLLTTDN
jgi:hypothetical protein